LKVLRTGDAVDLIRESVRMVLQELIEVEASESPWQISVGTMRRIISCCLATRSRSGGPARLGFHMEAIAGVRSGYRINARTVSPVSSGLFRGPLTYGPR
jgi:hypothetical protein